MPTRIEFDGPLPPDGCIGYVWEDTGSGVHRRPLTAADLVREPMGRPPSYGAPNQRCVVDFDLLILNDPPPRG